MGDQGYHVFAISYAVTRRTLRFTVLFFSSPDGYQSELHDSCELNETLNDGQGGVVLTYPSRVQYARNAVELLVRFFKENLTKANRRGLGIPEYLAGSFAKAIQDTEGVYINSGVDVRRIGVITDQEYIRRYFFQS
jgi:hypothetical protein